MEVIKLSRGKTQDILVGEDLDDLQLMTQYLTESNLEKVKTVITRFLAEKQDKARQDRGESIIELREDSAESAATQLSSVPLTQFDTEIYEIMAEIKVNGLSSVAQRRHILLTKTGNVDKRTRIGRVLFYKLLELE